MHAPSTFIDVLFIMLCALIVMLVDTTYLGGLESDPPDVGRDNAPAITERTMPVVIVGINHVGLEHTVYDTTDQLMPHLDVDTPLLVVSESDTVTHHRVMAVWNDLRGQGFDVKVGVQRTDATAGDAP